MREEAMKWWNNLSSLTKTQLCDTNTELTGREIEDIYKKGQFRA